MPQVFTFPTTAPAQQRWLVEGTLRRIPEKVGAVCDDPAVTVTQGDSTAPHPLNVLTDAALMENLVTYIIARRVTGEDEFALGLFMSYSADRIPVSEKIKMLGDIIDSFEKPPPELYPTLLDDLRLVNEVRVHVAHSMVVGDGSDPTRYVKWRRGREVTISEDELREQTRQAHEAATRATTALAILHAAQPSDPRLTKLRGESPVL